MLVRHGISQGKLIAFDDGSIDPALAKMPWRKGNIGANTANTFGSELTGELLSYADANRLKENNLAKKEGYQALLRKLEHEVKSARLVDAAAVSSKVFNLARVERDAWLNWPSRIAPLLAAEFGIDSVAFTVALEKRVREHLSDRAGAIDREGL